MNEAGKSGHGAEPPEASPQGIGPDSADQWDAFHPGVSALLIEDAQNGQSSETRTAFGETLDRLDHLNVQGLSGGKGAAAKRSSKTRGEGTRRAGATRKGAWVREERAESRVSRGSGRDEVSGSKETPVTRGESPPPNPVEGPLPSTALDAAALSASGLSGGMDPSGTGDLRAPGGEVRVTGLSGGRESRAGRIAGRLERLVIKGETTARIRLDPPALGTLQVEIEVRQGEVSLVVHAESSAAAGDLLLAAEQLKESLENQGLKLKEFELHQEGEASEKKTGEQGDDGDPHAASDNEKTVEVDIETNGISADGRLNLVV